ncbi:sulfite exporter TauE/SafE family protein [Arthrobacter sp. zg-Y20]|uniref:sulfite exporter TauE/SafE family protein n=1 Tax=unclassified Arthrobacter TaxID=235627 RepID=UPI001D13F0DF|nr:MULTISPECIES: sulfite exporter TauE/SafE family protein [unclassified Arthrobacter]MCC3276608.1 sulfite exporter TauE/SafE family protein [Arthrobacter sp. zg-Y20]MDK1316768.1 sulfite exporter TauE/SafE family protein [Arthrobacter sp. zg.Y20]WIB07758.1 sulfite exporter TauE/SafE family protein [Arthrobacter sp. zg-Y20]
MFVLGAAVAVVVGTVVGLVGAGGAIIAVPALVYLVGLPPDDAVPTSLIVVGLSSLAGLLPRLHTGINWILVAVLGIAGFPASWAGAALSERLDPDALMLLFAALMVVAGIRMLLAGRRIPGARPAAIPVRGPLLRGVAVGLAVGFLTGLLGVGGGFLLIPALPMFLGVPLQQAVGTSLAVITINSASGFSAHLAGLGMDWTLTLAFAAVAVAASLAAARLSRRLDDRLVSRIFALLVLLVAAWVTVQSLPAVVGQAAPPEAGAYEGQVRLAAPAEFTANVYAFVQGACAAR